MTRFILAFILSFVLIGTKAQELNCAVTVNTERLNNQKNPVFEDLRQSIFDLINGTTWTKEVFEEEERIKCNIDIILLPETDVTNNQFSAQVQIQFLRPVYGTNYESIVFSFQDNRWRFTYLSGQPLNYSKDFTSSNLVFLVSFYAYLIIAYDFDSFSLLGGSRYFQEALNVANNAQQNFSNANFGWNTDLARNRYWFCQDLTTPVYEDFRKGLYAYHRQGLDVFDKDPAKSLQEMIKVLKAVKELRNIIPISITLDTFINTKGPELYSAFSKAGPKTKQQFLDLIQIAYPSKRLFFRKLLKEN